MPDPILTNQTNTEPAVKVEDVKDETLMGSLKPAEDVVPDAEVKTDPPKGEVKTEPAKEEVKGAPEKYEFKPPQGVTYDPKMIEDFSAFAKSKGLAQAEADKLLDMGSQLIAQESKARESAWATAREGWRNEIKNDKEVGGSNFERSKEIALRAVNYAGIPELKDVFNKSGWGDHPAIFKAFVKFGKALGEDRFIEPSGGSSEKTAAQILYPSMKSNN